jgi:hypothetical protein
MSSDLLGFTTQLQGNKKVQSNPQIKEVLEGSALPVTGKHRKKPTSRH